MSTIIPNIAVTRIAAFGEEPLAIESGKVQNVFGALTQIYTTHNVYNTKEGRPSEACGLASNFRIENGGIVADLEFNGTNPSAGALVSLGDSLGSKYNLAIRLSGVSAKAAYQAGRLYGPDVADLVLVPNTERAVRFSREIAKGLRLTGNKAGAAFSHVVEQYAKQGVANPFAKAILTHKDLYLRYRDTFGQTDQTPAHGSRLESANVDFAVREINSKPPEERAKAILHIARKDPATFIAARNRRLI